MAASNINRVIITGNLTRDPELRAIGTSGLSVCELRVACNGRKKDNQSGQWIDKPNFFDVKVWGAQGENCAKFLSKGRPVAVDGRLEWSEWADKDSGKNRQKVEIIAESVQFLGGRDENAPSQGGASQGGGFTPTRSDVPVDTSDFGAPAAPQPVAAGNAAPAAPAPAPVAEDDIPF